MEFVSKSRLAKLKKLIFLLLFFLVFTVYKPSFSYSKKIFSEKPAILMVISPKDFREEELFIPEKLFKERGFIVLVASLKKGKAIGMFGKVVEVDLSLREVNPERFIGLVIVGGSGSPRYLWHNERLLNLVKRFYREGKVVSAICLSPAVLAEAGILKNKKATIFPIDFAIKELERYGAKFVNKGVVIDGRIITGQSPYYAREFALEILKKLKETQKSLDF